MGRFKFFPIEIDPWKGGISDLTLEERAVYLELLIHLFEEKELIKDEQHVMRIMQASGVTGKNIRFYRKVWANIAHKFRRNNRGSYHQKVSKLLKNDGKIIGLSTVVLDEEKNNRTRTRTRSKKSRKESTPAGVPPCPHLEIVRAYNRIIASKFPNPAVKEDEWDSESTRGKNLRARWKSAKKRQNLQYWETLFEFIAKQCPFLTGQEYSPGKDPFTPGLDWMIRPNNFTKIIEKHYQRK